MRRTLLLWLLPAFLAACSDAELVGVHVRLEADGSGVITSRTLVEGKEPGPAEAVAAAVTFTERASLSLSQGTFKNLGEVRFGELRFSGDVRNPERPGVRVHLERGADKKWVQALVPSAEARKKLAKVYDPTGKQREIAGSIQLELQLPGTVVSSGVLPQARGVEAAHERNRATLVIPVATALEKGDELVWDINWIAK